MVGHVWGPLLSVSALKQDFDLNNVPIKFEKNQWRNVASIMLTVNQGDLTRNYIQNRMVTQTFPSPEVWLY